VKVPAAYTVVRAAPVRAAIRRDLVPALGPWLLAPRLVPPSGAEAVAAGRGGAYRTTLPGELRVVVRPCRRGGVVARLARETYLGWRPRPLRELVVTAEVRRRGVAAAEVLAARVEGGFAYRGALVTAEVADATTLIDALRHAPDGAARGALAGLAGRAVGVLHEAGVFHADLNLTNMLVQRTGETTRVVFLDFDRAWLSTRPLGTPARRRNLRRLARSVAKLDPEGRLVGLPERAAFLATYDGAGTPGFNGLDACGY
jgi:3-deoxy-D-manno-octulosonic acid kinase